MKHRIRFITGMFIVNPFIMGTLLFSVLSQSGCQSSQIQSDRAPASHQEIILDHKYFKISYDKEHRLPKWVEYTLNKNYFKTQPGIRGNKFRPDPLLKPLGIAGIGRNDIPGDKYDRGHMAPADDFKRSQEALDETFVMSNVVPQKMALNRGAWLGAEVMAQKWACGENEVIIITGPVLRDDLPKLGNGISIPDKFFKAVYTRNKSKAYPKGKSICLIYGQDDDKTVEPKDRVTSVSECEKILGYDLGPRDLQFTENEYDFKDWRVGKCGSP